MCIKEILCVVSASCKEEAEGLEDQRYSHFLYGVRGQPGLPETLKQNQTNPKSLLQ